MVPASQEAFLKKRSSKSEVPHGVEIQSHKRLEISDSDQISRHMVSSPWWRFAGVALFAMQAENMRDGQVKWNDMKWAK